MARTRGFDEDRVLLAARNEFWRAGYAGARVDAIATATGLGKGSLYGAFGDKHQLFMRTFEAHCAELANRVRGALDGPDLGAFERLSKHVMSVADATGSDLEHRGCLLAKGTAELSEQDPAVAAVARRTFADIEQALSSCIAGAQRAGDISPDADPNALAGLILAVLRGIEALGKGGSSAAALRSIADTGLGLLPRVR